MCNVTNHTHVESINHPTLAKNIRTDSQGRARYSSSMHLPAYDDDRGILRFLGLTDEMIEVVVGRLGGGAGVSGARDSPGGSESEAGRFGALDELLAIYLGRSADIAHGLTPDLAAACGRIEVSPFFTRQVPGTSPFFADRIFLDHNKIRHDADELVKKNAAMLKDLWLQQQACEG
ncbi:hypothetical protein MCOR02_005539 [Pyricularia oryzae]|uniref:Uncharacterized protein n=2 Tax=Pyricularia oryzae TaxID=318829 RepID=G4ND87_PYRO7|nr:uncharacterized protein MGG_00287 [Pyricularia oryzae 70-15]KAH9433491.1 hypothetical protein MCOR02_005539 [Pyricularia oryzae]EHA49225.1 hypothetical protein MGG_00287 [Pyricularia oryzae 70-15]KAI6267451.1 hypothetical protein MCOR34_011783 [Pyricularia oryzae]KAI6421328.1 hypothetical protein MCOR22_011605 [Pyricularia oryzae]KAI6442335.1 hypothetical protein MCOR15_011441 [Pyricularia oryzae]